jgi:hypothetical protein
MFPTSQRLCCHNAILMRCVDFSEDLRRKPKGAGAIEAVHSGGIVLSEHIKVSRQDLYKQGWYVGCSGPAIFFPLFKNFSLTEISAAIISPLDGSYVRSPGLALPTWHAFILAVSSWDQSLALNTYTFAPAVISPNRLLTIKNLSRESKIMMRRLALDFSSLSHSES